MKPLEVFLFSSRLAKPFKCQLPQISPRQSHYPYKVKYSIIKAKNICDAWKNCRKDVKEVENSFDGF